MKNGFLSIILHAHLPYVRHPEYDSFFEENWLFEAITECYIPLIGVLDRLFEDKVDYRLTLSLSPPLSIGLSAPQRTPWLRSLTVMPLLYPNYLRTWLKQILLFPQLPVNCLF